MFTVNKLHYIITDFLIVKAKRMQLIVIEIDAYHLLLQVF